MRITEVSEQVRSEAHRSATVGEIAVRCNLEEREVIEAQEADRARRTTSLDVPSARGEADSVPVVETIGTKEGGYERAEAQLASELADLRPKERAALDLRFHQGLTQHEIGTQIGVSQMQVSRLLRSGMGKLLLAVRGGEELEPSALQPVGKPARIVQPLEGMGSSS